jgi:cell division protein ZapA (FtsZ GTPase activity inhibitor)
MILLTISIAILDEHTCLTCLESDAPFIAALGTAVDRRIAKIMAIDV